MSANNRTYTPVVPAAGSVLVPDATAPFGTSFSLVDHTLLTNKGTNTHAQLDTFVASKGANSGLATLDVTGQVPSAQLGNVVKPVAKGQLIVGNGSAPALLSAGATNQLLVADSAQPNGVKWAQGDHTTLSSIGTNTHAQIDAFITSKAAASGLASLDGAGYVPTSQLGNVVTAPAKGSILVGNGTVPTAVAVGTNNYTVIADSTQATGVKWGQYDHTQLTNKGTNTHAQIDTFISSKGVASGLATLDTSSYVPTAQLGNVGSTAVVSGNTTNVNKMLTFFKPWTDAAWSADLAAIKNAAGATQVPVYKGAISGGSNNTYFVNMSTVSTQPTVIEITLNVARTVSLVFDSGNNTFVPTFGMYVLEPGLQSILIPAPCFAVRTVSAATYTDMWSAGNSVTFASPTSVLGFYIGIGFPSGPTTFPPNSPFGFGYTCDTSPYLTNATTVQIRGWR